MFPDSDPAFKDADSLKLLALVAERLEKEGFTVGNIDATVIAQNPKMKPHIDRMRKNIASACKIDLSFVSVKATTEEWLGFTGSGEGIAAHAVCIINDKVQ